MASAVSYAVDSGATYYSHWNQVDVEDFQSKWPNFHPRELASNRDGSVIVNPSSLDKLQALRTTIDAPFTLVSAYRDPIHNASPAVRGASDSQHMYGRAFDIHMGNHDPVEFEAAAKAAGFTGFGHYNKVRANGTQQNFMHIDTGSPRKWGDNVNDYPNSGRGGTYDGSPIRTTPTPVVASQPSESQNRRANRSGRSADELKRQQLESQDKKALETAGTAPAPASPRDTPSGRGNAGTDTIFSTSRSQVGSYVLGNPLDGYSDVIYNIALSIVQNPAGTGMSYSDLMTRPTDPFASTGEVLGGPSDLFLSITDMTFKIVSNITAENPDLAQVMEGSMGIIEPHGLSFEDRIRTRGYDMGYTDVVPSRIVWRLDIWWSGYDSNGSWVQKIPFASKHGTSSTITHFIHIVTLEAGVNPEGTKYDISFLPINFIALRPEAIALNGFNITASTFQGFLDNLGAELTESSKDDKSTDVTYVFEVDPSAKELASQGVADLSKALDRNMLVGPNDNFSITLGRDSSVLYFLRTALNGMAKVQEDFIAKNDPNRIKPRISYVIRPEAEYGTSATNPITKDYSQVTYKYIIHKQLDWRGPLQNVDTQDNPAFQKQRISQIMAAGALRRIYNYTYTSTNSEVLSMDIKLKFFYFQNTHDPKANRQSTGANTPETQDEIEKRLKANKQNSVNQGSTPNAAAMEAAGASGNANNELAPANQDSRVNQRPRYNPDSGLSRNRQRANASRNRMPLHGTNRNGGQADGTGNQSGNETSERKMFDQQTEDRLNADLLTLDNLSVRGDPNWLMVDVDFNDALVSDVIQINVRTPDQDDYMSEPWSSNNPGSNITLGGLYEIISVDNTFSGGVFTQKLDGYKLINHGSLDSTDISISSSSGGTNQTVLSLHTATTGSSNV